MAGPAMPYSYEKGGYKYGRNSKRRDINTAKTEEIHNPKTESGIFTELCASLEGLSLTEGARTETARKILAAFSHDGGNFLQQLRDNHNDSYSRLLHEISRCDYDTLLTFCDYPNSLAFLLKTGIDGKRLTDLTRGQIIALTMILPDDEQKRLPEIFRRYPAMSEALRYCGGESFFNVMICPEFFFTLTELLDGTRQERFTIARAVILAQPDDILSSLSPDDARRIARYTAEIMNLPGDCSLLPLRSPMFTALVRNYGEDALCLCKDYGAVADVPCLLMNDWGGLSRDVEPVVSAMRDFGVMGLQAAEYFRLSGNVQGLVLGWREFSRRRDLLMFMLYDEASGHSLTENIGGMYEGAGWMLSNYRADSKTGEPVAVDDGVLWEYVPGHDVTSVLWNWAKYGKTPTVGETWEAAWDIVGLINITQSAKKALVNIAQGVAKGQAKEALMQEAEKAVSSFIDDAPDNLTDCVKKYLSHKAGSLRVSSPVTISIDLGAWTDKNVRSVVPVREISEATEGRLNTAGISALKNYLAVK